MAKHLNFSINFNGKDSKIKILLTLIQFKDSGSIVIFAPAIEVYGYGKTVSEAKKSFEIGLLEFIKYTTAKGTFFKEMKRMGWDIKKRKEKIDFKMPVFTELVEKNKNLNKIVNERDYKKFSQNIPIAIPV